MVQMGVTHVVATRVMREAYHEWKCIPKVKQTWNQWKEHSNDAFNELKELNSITAESMGYGAINITVATMALDVAMALDNLASAAIAKNTLDALVAANKQLAHALAHVTKENVKLLSMVRQSTTNVRNLKNTNMACQTVIVGLMALS